MSLEIHDVARIKGSLKKLCHEIYQKSYVGNCRQIDWNTKKTLKTL